MKIYTCSIKSISEPELEKSFFEMSRERRKNVMQLKNPEKQKSKIAADRVCRKALSEFCGVDPQRIEFGMNEHGKPFAIGLDVHFNVSHSGDWVVCAVSDKEIGIDIEKIRSVNPRAAEKFACSDELEYIKITENGFFEIWTLKEAYFKCIGTGLDSNIKSVSFKVGKKVDCSESGFDCSFHEIANEYICAVCEKST